jgi:hypothetical protein
LKIKDVDNQEKILPYCVFQFIVEYDCFIKDFETDSLLVSPTESFQKARGTAHVVMNEDGQFLIHDIDIINGWVKKGLDVEIPIIPNILANRSFVPDIYSILNRNRSTESNQKNPPPDQNTTN